MTQTELFEMIAAQVETERIFGLEPKPVPRATGRAMDALPIGYKPYHLCSDGILRTAEERDRWVKAGMWDERSEQRRQLRK
jgi:hypothetical protein